MLIMEKGIVMKKGELLGKVLLLATTAHAGQFDRGGNPYILHPLKVMHYLKSDDEELQCIALLHDVIEDTRASWADLRAIGCTDRIIAAVEALTKMPGQTYDEYKQRVFANTDAMKVKLCDLRHNTDIRRLKGISEKDILRLEKYNRFFLEILNLLKKNA
jgi:(p)ppGpp synthase/HD superfamily hydrolase